MGGIGVQQGRDFQVAACRGRARYLAPGQVEALASLQSQDGGGVIVHRLKIVAVTMFMFTAAAASAQNPLDAELPRGKKAWGSPTGGYFAFRRHCSSCHSERDSFEPAHKTGTCFVDATRLFNYVKQKMPPAAVGALTDGDLYDVVALILFEQQLIPRTVFIDYERLPKVVMPNSGFIRAECPIEAGGLGKFTHPKDGPEKVPLPPQSSAAVAAPPQPPARPVAPQSSPAVAAPPKPAAKPVAPQSSAAVAASPQPRAKPVAPRPAGKASTE
jgi:hypothetical protein